MNDIEQKLKEIQFLAHDLVFVSETDSDVNAFVAGRNITKLSAETFARANYYIGAETVGERSFAEWSQTVTGNDPAWQTLVEYLGGVLVEPKVFIDGAVRRVYYVCGLYQNSIIGVSFLSVET